jgi:pyruvate-ferredoxin/flavodoxin oxidoreductase
VCVDICPAKSKEEVKHKAINMEPKDDHLDHRAARFDFFLHPGPRIGRGEGSTP